MLKSRNAKKPGRKKSSPELTEAEWTIMKVVWEEEPCAAGTVQEALAQSKDWTYGTVKNTMDRMVKKGFLQVERIRNLQLFRSAISESQARKKEFRKMLTRAFDGALTPLMQFLIENEDFSQEDLKQLRHLAHKVQRKK